MKSFLPTPMRRQPGGSMQALEPNVASKARDISRRGFMIGAAGAALLLGFCPRGGRAATSTTDRQLLLLVTLANSQPLLDAVMARGDAEASGRITAIHATAQDIALNPAFLAAWRGARILHIGDAADQVLMLSSLTMVGSVRLLHLGDHREEKNRSVHALDPATAMWSCAEALREDMDRAGLDCEIRSAGIGAAGRSRRPATRTWQGVVLERLVALAGISDPTFPSLDRRFAPTGYSSLIVDI